MTAASDGAAGGAGGDEELEDAEDDDELLDELLLEDESFLPCLWCLLWRWRSLRLRFSLAFRLALRAFLLLRDFLLSVLLVRRRLRERPLLALLLPDEEDDEDDDELREVESARLLRPWDAWEPVRERADPEAGPRSRRDDTWEAVREPGAEAGAPDGAEAAWAAAADAVIAAMAIAIAMGSAAGAGGAGAGAGAGAGGGGGGAGAGAGGGAGAGVEEEATGAVVAWVGGVVTPKPGMGMPMGQNGFGNIGVVRIGDRVCLVAGGSLLRRRYRVQLGTRGQSMYGVRSGGQGRSGWSSGSPGPRPWAPGRCRGNENPQRTTTKEPGGPRPEWHGMAWLGFGRKKPKKMCRKVDF